MQSKVCKSDVDKLVPVFVDLSKLSDVVKSDVAKEVNMMNWLKTLMLLRLLILAI